MRLEDVGGVEIRQDQEVETVVDGEGPTQILLALPLQILEAVLVCRSQQLVALVLDVVDGAPVDVDQHVVHDAALNVAGDGDLPRGFLLHVVLERCLEERRLGAQNGFVTREGFVPDNNVDVREVSGLQKIQKTFILSPLLPILALKSVRN